MGQQARRACSCSKEALLLDCNFQWGRLTTKGSPKATEVIDSIMLCLFRDFEFRHAEVLDMVAWLSELFDKHVDFNCLRHILDSGPCEKDKYGYLLGLRPQKYRVRGYLLGLQP